MQTTTINSNEEIKEKPLPKWLREKILKAEQEPEENDTVLETEEDIHNYFLHLKKPNRKK